MNSYVGRGRGGRHSMGKPSVRGKQARSGSIEARRQHGVQGGAETGGEGEGTLRITRRQHSINSRRHYCCGYSDLAGGARRQ